MYKSTLHQKTLSWYSAVPEIAFLVLLCDKKKKNVIQSAHRDPVMSA